MNISKIAILADLEFPIHTNQTSSKVVFTHELVQTLYESQKSIGGISLTLFARKGSVADIPIVSLNPDELSTNATDKVTQFSLQETMYMQLLLSGMLQNYDIIHCLAPIVTPLLILANQNKSIIHTPLDEDHHPSSQFPGKLLTKSYLRLNVESHLCGQDVTVASPSVDLKRFYPIQSTKETFLLSVEEMNEEDTNILQQMVKTLELPLKTISSVDPHLALPQAKVLLHFPSKNSNCSMVWPLRAMAAGVPVVGWNTSLASRFLTHPKLGAFVPVGDAEQLIREINNLTKNEIDVTFRREYALAFFNRRGVAARYRHLYSEMLKS